MLASSDYHSKYQYSYLTVIVIITVTYQNGYYNSDLPKVIMTVITNIVIITVITNIVIITVTYQNSYYKCELPIVCEQTRRA